ncbi:MAG: DUF1887 family protein [Candidatus Marinimicrobia bacterium]|nr:DUF1887 family protein [Candidatus Neomarinimicrobiota bacterium]
MENFTDLILLIGTSPLPNLVVAKYFAQKNDNLKRIWMLCSDENDKSHQASTEKYARKIKKLLSEQFDGLKFPCIQKIEDINKSQDIKDSIESISGKISEYDNVKVHLNYTGGTKTMVAHSYQYLKELYTDGITFSYLSSRDFKIFFDDSNSASNDIRKIVKCSIKELLEVHKFDYDPVVEPDFQDVYNYLTNLLESEKQNESINSLFNDEAYSKLFKSRPFQSFENITYNSLNNVWKKINDLLPNENKLYINHNNFYQFNFRDWRDTNFNDTIRYLSGIWLEDYVYKVLEEWQGFDDIMKNVKFKKDDMQITKKHWPEIDIVMTNGYQLVGTSCTTSEKMSICKSKGFEVILRSKQIGGDESKAILMCGIKDESKIKQLEQDLTLATGNIGNIKVIGRNYWSKINLISELNQFLEVV